MPIVRIDYNKEVFSDEKMQSIAETIQVLSAQVTGYDTSDISVFASPNCITVNAAPIEVYIYATFPHETGECMEKMLEELKGLIIRYKEENDIATPFNLSVVKMDWKFQLEV